MARLDVYRLPGKVGRGYFLNVQASMLDHLATRTVVPLLPLTPAAPPIKDLNPIFEIDGKPFIMLTQAIATVPVRDLQQIVVSLDNRHDDITRALDTLLIGY